jgi:hypothetical protein
MFLFVSRLAQTHTAAHTLGDPVQTFADDMFRLEGQIIGDPDFDTLIVRAGTDFGMPSPGSTTLTELPGGDYDVDSFFDLSYKIEFAAALLIKNDPQKDDNAVLAAFRSRHGQSLNINVNLTCRLCNASAIDVRWNAWSAVVFPENYRESFRCLIFKTSVKDKKP